MNGGMVTVRCEAGFNQISKDNIPYVLCKANGTDKWIKTRFENVEGLNYTASIVLRPQDSYTYQIFIDGETQYSGNTEEIATYLYKYTEFRGMLLGGYDHRNDNSRTHLSIQLEPMSMATFKSLQFQAGDVVLYSSGKELGTVNMQPIDRTSENDVKQEYASGNSSQVTVSEESMSGVFTATLDFGSYKEVVDRITVKVTYNDGYIVEKEIYPKIEE